MGDVLVLVVLHGFAVDGYEPPVVVFGDYLRHQGVLSEIERLRRLLLKPLAGLERARVLLGDLVG